MKYKIVVIEDDPSIQELLIRSLEMSGHVVKATDDGKDAINLISSENPDLIVLDWNLPRLTGIQICNFIRSNPKIAKTPILMLTVFKDIQNKVNAFQTGVDDYLTKPFDLQEFSVRVKALLNRKAFEEASEVIECAGIKLNVTMHTVTVNGKGIQLRPKEFELLRVLLSAQGRVVSRQHLKERVWGYDSDIISRTLDCHIARIREKLGTKVPKMIHTVPGFGYKIEKTR